MGQTIHEEQALLLSYLMATKIFFNLVNADKLMIYKHYGIFAHNQLQNLRQYKVFFVNRIIHFIVICLNSKARSFKANHNKGISGYIILFQLTTLYKIN